MTDPSVERRFSIGASRYEAYAHVQRLTAADLLAFTLEAASGARVARILEPGCGTGLYTRMLLDAFPGATIDGVDISEAMIRLARERTADPRARFARADAEEIVAGRYDLVTSNATFQWFLAFGRTVRRLAALLPDGGLLTFSFFGPGTVAERAAARRAESSAGGDAGARDGGARRAAERPAAAAFLSRRDIEAALSDVFPRADVVERVYRQEFRDLADLLRSIRYTGTGGGGPRGAWTPGRLARVERAYRERFGGIHATYQVFLCRGFGRKGGPP
jgi:malonyl-ACP O-methyltransferase BioC